MSFSTSDTVVAIATPPGRGGIGVVRISGPDAEAIARALVVRDQPFEPRHATFGVFKSSSRTPDQGVVPTSVRTNGAVVEPCDHVVVTYFPAPHSYTGEHVAELSAHGSPVVLQAIVRAALSHGARLAEPGEFTLRAFLNGRMDLPQAEAVADLIAAVTPVQVRAAFDQLQGTLTRDIAGIDRALFEVIARLEASVDFPEEGYHFIDQTALAMALGEVIDRTTALLRDAQRGRLIREGLHVVIVGKPNVGKSSVFNRLAGVDRAIVTPVAGTTRDLVTETVDLVGLRTTLVDTAGLRDALDVVEAEGIFRSKRALEVADLVIVVLDGSTAPDELDADVMLQTSNNKRLIVQNKVDIPSKPRANALLVSAMTGQGFSELRQAIATALDVDPQADGPAITNVRHIALVGRAHDALTRARDAIGTAGGASLSEEFVLADLQAARFALEEITGVRTSEDVLSHIFSTFCIGK